MTVFWRSRWLLFLAPTLLAAAAPVVGLDCGEALTYRVSWAILPGAGEITIAGFPATDSHGKPLLRVLTHTSTRGLARLILPFDARADALFDLQSGRLAWLSESSSTRGKELAHTVTFHYSNNTADYRPTLPPSSARVLALPTGYPTDLITCLVSARTWNLAPGGTHEALALFEDDFYDLTVHALGYETIETPLGAFRALVLEPRMERTPPKGMFRHGSTVRVWVADDPRHLPVRFQVDFKFGAGIATLTEYRPPAPK
jgi:hypothetical protein